MTEKNLNVPVGYPFAAVVGQDDYKLALLACAVDPGIGGVLAIGDRGSAKSTLARSFAELLPGVASGGGSAPFIELPLGATLERLTGSIDSARLLAGDGSHLTPGLLARSDGGVLYVDEVNLLGDHLVDVMLDAAAFGVVHVERDGLSARQAARFVLVGTMNPEEGPLRPQLLDRFGLSVQIGSPEQSGERAAIVSRRIAFERDPGLFADRYSGTTEALREIVSGARAVLPAVELPDELLAMITEACPRLGVEGMRGDIVTVRTATALAALDGRSEVIERDVLTAARLALGHRAAARGTETKRLTTGEIEAAFLPETTTRLTARAGERGTEPHGPRTVAGRELVTGAAGSGEKKFAREPAREPNVPAFRSLAQIAEQRRHAASGRGARASGGERPAVDSAPAAHGVEELQLDLDPIATARAAVTRRLVAGAGSPRTITTADLHERVRAGRDANLVICVVDASSSVLEGGRGGELRALLAGLVADARNKRDRIGMVVFRGRGARLVAPPSRNHSAVLAAIDTIEPGGTTPLAEGIRVAHDSARRELRRNPELRPVVVLVTDGYANVGRGGDALADARAAARELRGDGIGLVVVGESDSGAPAFARATVAEFYPFDPAGDRRSAA